jgi:hypothetical protein
MPLCPSLTGDGLYAAETTMAACIRLGWNRTPTLTEGKQPMVSGQLLLGVNTGTGRIPVPTRP